MKVRNRLKNHSVQLIPVSLKGMMCSSLCVRNFMPLLESRGMKMATNYGISMLAFKCLYRRIKCTVLQLPNNTFVVISSSYYRVRLYLMLTNQFNNGIHNCHFPRTSPCWLVMSSFAYRLLTFSFIYTKCYMFLIQYMMLFDNTTP